jgi:hypothetical protein
MKVSEFLVQIENFDDFRELGKKVKLFLCGILLLMPHWKGIFRLSHLVNKVPRTLTQRAH